MAERDTIPRWRYRFENYKQTFSLLRELMELKRERRLSEFEAVGGIQLFNMTFELAWKTIKDYLESAGVHLAERSPRSIIIAGIEAGLITHRENWMSALKDRNTMSHKYSQSDFLEIINNIEDIYMNMFNELYETFHAKGK